MRYFFALVAIFFSLLYKYQNSIVLSKVDSSSTMWYIMEKLWEEHPRTIVQLYHSLKETPGWSKSTVNTLLGRMVDKGILYFEEGTKAKQYYPAVGREDAALAETESLLKRVYHGSVSMMINTLVQKDALSDKEIEELYGILEKAR